MHHHHRLEDGTLLSDSMPTPEELSARAARKFRHDGDGGGVLLFDDAEDVDDRKRNATAGWDRFLVKMAPTTAPTTATTTTPACSVGAGASRDWRRT